MSSLDDTRSVERQRFFDGQRLFADDLQRIEQFHREMRWLHNASLHQPGIGNGFAASGRKGDREVVVGPGYAIDDRGREIVLTSSRTLPVPPVAGAGGQPQLFVLTVQYPDDTDLEEVERRAGLCGTDGAVRLREEPIFCWVPLNPNGSPARDQADILAGRHLVLAEAAVRDCRLDRDIGIVQRRNARPPTQPYVACGVEVPTRWRDWNPPWEDPELQVRGVPLGNLLRGLFQVAGGLTAEIDTRSAGFRTVPCYFARIDGKRPFPANTPEALLPVVLDGQLSIVKPTPKGFRVNVIVLAFTANRTTTPIDEGGGIHEGGGVNAIGPVAHASAGGFDVSALMLHSLGTLLGGEHHEAEGDSGDAAAAAAPVVAAAAAPAAAALVEAGAAADGTPTLLELVGDAWTVGWMGVEG